MSKCPTCDKLKYDADAIWCSNSFHLPPDNFIGLIPDIPKFREESLEPKTCNLDDENCINCGS